ncbi:MAG: YbdD/YjiX family protein [Xanthomonadaceae bacterium]|nr:YbdD/YjiX family protein [Xanthomonadaceae bacterium]
MTPALRQWGRLLQQTMHLMVGLPDYAAYLEHMRRFHPERRPMSEAEFFRDRQAARYRRGGGRCC